MGNVLVVAGKELRSLTRDGRVRLAALAVLAMLVVAFAASVAQYASVSRERATAERVIHEQWLEQGEKNPHAAAHYGLYAFRPATPLTFFDSGVTSYEGVSIWLEAHKRNLAQGRPAEDMTSLARFGELTIAFGLQVLMPLLVVLLCYGAFAGEREQGTLRQVLSSGVTPRQLLLGKALGLGAGALLILSPVLVGGFIALLASAEGRALLPEAVVLLGCYLAYGAIFLLLSLAVSARARHAQTALVALLGFWVVATFVVPRFAVDVARLLHPAPTAAAFEQAIEADLQGELDGTTVADRIEQRREQLLKLYKVDDVNDLPINFQGLTFRLQEDFGNAVYGKHFDALGQQLERQTDVYEALAVLSPRMALALVSQELSGTSPRRARQFADEAEAFRRSFIGQLNDALLYSAGQSAASVRAGRELWERIGVFEPRKRTLGEVLQPLGAPLMVLLLWLLATLGAAVAAVRGLKATIA